MDARTESVETAAYLMDAISIAGVRFYYNGDKSSGRCQELVGQIQSIDIIDDGLDVEFTVITLPDYSPARLKLSTCEVAPLDEAGRVDWSHSFTVASAHDIAHEVSDLDQGLSDLLGP